MILNSGELIRSYRKRKGLTLKELGDKVGLSDQAISQYERSLRTPNIFILQKICSELNLPIEYLSYDYLPVPTPEQIDENERLMLDTQINLFIDDVDRLKVDLMCKVIESFNYSIEIDKNIVVITDNVTDKTYAIIPKDEFINISEVFSWNAEGLVNNLKHKYNEKRSL